MLGVALPNRPAGRHDDTPDAGDGEFQALLLPDWLKLRMIRSEVPRLVDAGTGGLAGPGGLSPGWPGHLPPQ